LQAEPRFTSEFCVKLQRQDLVDFKKT